MISSKVARQGLDRAGRWLRGAQTACKDGRWDDVVYCAQMAVEQSSKAVLFSLGIDFPKEHDVSGVFEELAKRDDLPIWFRKLVPETCDAIAELAKKRGLAGYGFEEGIDANYFRDYAPKALQMAMKVHVTCKKLLNKIFKSKE